MEKEKTNVEKIVTNGRFRMYIRDWNREYKFDLLTKNGFRITEKGKTDLNTKAGMYSIHSPLYGTEFAEGELPEDRWTCGCSNPTIGATYNGTICPNCGNKVEFIETNMKMTGWIVFDKDYIIQPEMFKKIQLVIGIKNLNNIIKYKEVRERNPEVPYDGIGMIDFMENFDEILYSFARKKSSKADQYRFLMMNRDLIFVNCVPVYSAYLRNFVVRNEEIRYSDDDKAFRRIFSNSLLLNDSYQLERRLDNWVKRNASGNTTRKKTISDMRREGILYAIQQDVNLLWDMSFETIKKKSGVIRNSILGGRLNFTARNVIIPSKTLKANEIELGYATFLEMFKLEIISLMEVMYDNIPHPQLWTIWKRAVVHFDPRIYKIMEYMVQRGVYCEINRNPTEPTYRSAQ